MITLDLITLLLMIVSFIVFLAILKLPSGLSLMISSVLGLACGCIIHAEEGLPFDVRYLIEGGFGYIDCLLVIICAMVFIKFLEKSGGLDYLTAVIIKVFHNYPTILLTIFMALLLLPGMVTGSSTAAVVSIGIIIAPILLRLGLSKKATAAFIGFGAILGMVAPPINIPVMAICDVVDISYSGFNEPLFILTLPLAAFGAIFFSRDFKNSFNSKGHSRNVVESAILTGLFMLVCAAFFAYYKIKEKALYKEIALLKAYLLLVVIMMVICTVMLWAFKPKCNKLEVKENDYKIFDEIKWTSLVPLIVIVILFIVQPLLLEVQNAFVRSLGMVGTPLLFIIASIFALFFGKKFNAIKACDSAIERCIGVLGLLMGVGMFVEVLSVTGARGLIVINVLKLLYSSKEALYVAMAVSLSAFGGISSFASASVFGGPFVMALYGKIGYKIVASACSLIAAVGEFLPPTAMSARLASKNLNDIKLEGEDDTTYSQVSISCAIPLIVTVVWAMIIVIYAGPIVK